MKAMNNLNIAMSEANLWNEIHQFRDKIAACPLINQVRIVTMEKPLSFTTVGQRPIKRFTLAAQYHGQDTYGPVAEGCDAREFLTSLKHYFQYLCIKNRDDNSWLL